MIFSTYLLVFTPVLILLTSAFSIVSPKGLFIYFIRICLILVYSEVFFILIPREHRIDGQLGMAFPLLVIIGSVVTFFSIFIIKHFNRNND